LAPVLSFFAVSILLVFPGKVKKNQSAPVAKKPDFQYTEKKLRSAYTFPPDFLRNIIDTGGSTMEIERKFLIPKENLPADLKSFPCHHIEQGYLCTSPVVRIRRQDDDYFLTYKSKGLMAREEYNLPLTPEAYQHLRPKADGILISKDRYVLPEKNGLFIELDIFHDTYEGVFLAEVEFPTEEAANAYNPPEWFGEDVTYSTKYHNSTMSQGWQ